MSDFFSASPSAILSKINMSCASSLRETQVSYYYNHAKLYDFLGVDKGFVPNTSTKHNPAGFPKFRLLNYLYFHPTLIRTAKLVVPENMWETAERVQQQNLGAAPKLPSDLRAELLTLTSKTSSSCSNYWTGIYRYGSKGPGLSFFPSTEISHYSNSL